MNKVENKGGLVSAAEVVVALPEFFSERNQVLRLAKRRVIPCYVLPGTGRRALWEVAARGARKRNAPLFG